jgi:hypothetical protein
MLFLVLDEF